MAKTLLKIFGVPRSMLPEVRSSSEVYGETTVLDKWESRSKDDRGVVHVETIGYKQDGTVVCVFRRKVMVPKRSYGETRGGEQPGEQRRLCAHWSRLVVQWQPSRSAVPC